jgi:HK97 family phage major capsid protein
MNIEELRARLNTLGGELEKMKSAVATENRSATDEEKGKSIAIMEEIDSIDHKIADMEFEERVSSHVETVKRSQSAPTKPDVKRGYDENKKFRTFGEFMQAVVMAGTPGNRIDARLVETRAATGMGEGIPSDGGFLVQTDFAAELIKRTYETGQVVSRARRIPIGANANGIKLNAVSETSRVAGSRWGGIVAYWLAEAGTKTASAPKFRQMELSLKKLIGLCYATDELLQDASALESVIMQGFAEEFGFQLDDALISGTGAGQPLGILNSAARVAVGRTGGGAVVSADVINMWSRCWAKSRVNAVWFINQDLEPQLHSMVLGAGSFPSYMPPGGLSQSPYATLFGRPVIPIEQCQTMGTVGDIILADMSEYILIDKGGIANASSIHVQFLTDQTVFRFVYRCDGRKLAAHSSNAMMNSSLIRGTLNSEKSMAIPSQATAMPWACVETVQEPAYLN